MKSPIVRTLIITGVCIGLVGWIFFLNEELLFKFQATIPTMLLPSILSAVNLFYSQQIIKRNSRKDTSDNHIRKDIYAQLKELKQNEAKLEGQLVEVKERLLILETLVKGLTDKEY